MVYISGGELYWISEDPVYVVVRNATPALYDTQGRLVSPERRRVFAKFERGIAPPWARDIGLSTFEFRRMPERGIAREQWLAFYDVDADAIKNGWTDEEKEAIVTRLDSVSHAALRVEPPKPKAPWPAYDRLVPAGKRTIELVAAKIVEKITEDGYSPEQVLEYERAFANRPEVIEAIEALLVPEPEEPAETVVPA